ncbi:MAG: hypothetical protein PUB69_00350 [Desulfovibrionaceae bacterium]|nr:hypothetical protein [Desulfovibrionaceae bacterium]
MPETVYSYDPDLRNRNFCFQKITDAFEAGKIFDKIHEDRLSWAYFPDSISREYWIRLQLCPGHHLIAAYENRKLAGIMEAHPPISGSFVYEVGMCALRDFFSVSVPLGMCAIRFLLNLNADCVGLMGRIPQTNRHALNLYDKLGFSMLCRVPGYFRIREKKGRVADGIFVFGSRQELLEANRAFSPES